MQNLNWWRGGVIYQIYPRSFQDSNGDGIGDLKGITSRLDYIQSLGVDGIWISPFFTSPMKDFGYDVSDYCDVDPMFGTLADFDELIAGAHQRNIKVLIDLVISHSSDQHPWFVESRQNTTNEKADWYVWADPKDDGNPPNNWLSIFGGPAWQWDARREQYYLHNFLVSQPDLNFHNPQVQDALLNSARFWLERGVDGFRLDTINFYFHDQQLRNNPPLAKELRDDIIAPKVNPYNHQIHQYDRNRPENLDFLKRFRSLLDEFPGSTCVGEVGDAQRGLEIIGEYTKGNDGVHMCYAFEMLSLKKPNAEFFKNLFERVDEAMPEGWACWAYSNHDVVRQATRIESSEAAQRLMSMIMFCLRGSVCIYQGEELGLPEADVPFEKLQDPYGIEFWPEFKGRDGCRTPMVWNDDLNAGFSAGEPWLPVSEVQMQLNVQRQTQDSQSMLNFYRALVAMRKGNLALQSGSLEELEVNGNLLSFWRNTEGQSLFCAFNLSEQNVQVPKPCLSMQVKSSGIYPVELAEQTFELAPWQGVVLAFGGQN